MTRTYRIDSIHHVVDIATTLRKSWFRGHSRMFGELVPRIFRQPYLEPFTWFRQDIELETLERFKRDAPSLSDRRLPAEEDTLSWLCLMQHHGSPTRLLDWSERILIALYFAVGADHAQDGELWAMDPNMLNEAAVGIQGLPVVSKAKTLQFLIRQAQWRGTADALAADLELSSAVTNPIAFLHRFGVSRRITAQSGAFTIHPPTQPGHTIRELVTDERHLVRYQIPASKKAELLQCLEPLGVSHLQLFQDLDALSRQVCADHNEIGWGPPDPPRCGGLVPETSETVPPSEATSG
jgi:hypothetical protein